MPWDWKWWSKIQNSSDAVSGWAGWALAHPEFGVLVNPIPTIRAGYAHRIIACLTGFENLTASLNKYFKFRKDWKKGTK